ncbi:hypothetical protein Athai_28220 [Actinocatenispora thailandica]|uniref:Uncharacterized protein n=1 Tax=Actinocatenispora thailandica TaxID=227318 RepID=A0A7R7DP42_9ACTN|nr:hypothetical protein Athai_28220 [Actinocatenispora thailandica]
MRGSVRPNDAARSAPVAVPGPRAVERVGGGLALPDPGSRPGSGWLARFDGASIILWTSWSTEC